MMRSIFLTAALLALATGVAGAQIAFDPGVSYAMVTTPDASALGDFDGDGYLDLATTSDAPDRIVIRLNAGDGTFGNAASVFLTNSSSPHTPVARDLDNDGDVDIAVTLKDFNMVQVVVNQGSGSFLAGATFAVGVEPRDLVAGDLTGNGLPDLVSSNRGSDNVTVLINSGALVFVPTPYPVGTRPAELGLADFTGDGWVDFAVASQDSDRVDLYRNLTGGVFAPLLTLSTAPLGPQGLAVADFDRNGTPDIAVSGSNNNAEWAGVYLNQGGAVFGGRNDYLLGNNPQVQDASSLLAADFNRDALPDLVSANTDSDDVAALAGTGGGAFGAAQTFNVGTGPGHVVSGDLDGNLSPDLVSTNELSNDVTVLINQASCLTTYCTAGTSASGCQALMSGSGTPSATAASGFLLLATNVEGNKDGLFFYGSNGRQANPWGTSSSYQCVVPPVRRGALLMGTGTNGSCDGQFSFDLNARWTAKPQHNPGEGAIVQAQLWYRDPQSTSNQTTSLSDALEFCVFP
jgi:hypothetical protein